MLKSILGDSIHVHRRGSPPGKWFAGRVHRVRMAEVGLGFDPSFRPPPGALFGVHFKLNRYPLRRQHQALDTAFQETRVLFPTATHIKNPAPVRPGALLPYFNHLIRSNPAQVAAVSSIISLAPGSPPFVVFGPREIQLNSS
jgi:helicase MOV-10